MNKVLYRNESYYGSGVRELRSIIEYEMSELRNSDIPQYVLKHYKLEKNLKKKLKELLEKRLDWDYPFVGAIDCRRELFRLIGEMISAVSQQTGINCKYGLWLTGLKDVQNLYSTGDCQIDGYETTQALFSDLGTEGKLFGYAKLPNKI